ncbi:MAG: PPOX class F420-dependent oxidoreductase [Actinomycetota bacterium]
MTEIPTEFKDLLDKKGFGHIATIGPNGEPQSSPVWYDFDGHRILFSQTKDRQKYRNLKRDPHVSISIHDPDDPYRYLEVRGVAEIVDDPDFEFIDSMAKKYLGKEEYPWRQPGEERVVVKIEPEHIPNA